MHIRKLFGGTIVAGILLISLVPVHASNPVPDSACHVECENVYVQEAGVCGRIAAEKESLQCGNDANAHYRKCGDECDEMLTKCIDKCYEDYNDNHKKCEKIPDIARRTKCRQAAGEQHGDCVRKCRRKKRSGD